MSYLHARLFHGFLGEGPTVGPFDWKIDVIYQESQRGGV